MCVYEPFHVGMCVRREGYGDWVLRERGHGESGLSVILVKGIMLDEGWMDEGNRGECNIDLQ